MRINKFLSNSGFCSRRHTNKLIEDKRVTINGILCTPGQWLEEGDVILVDNKPLPVKEKVYIAFNKPTGITCTASREVEGNIMDFVNYPDYIFPVGRLDKNSQGLILMTNDGELSNRIINSVNKHEKEYIVTLDRSFDDNFMKEMSEGVDISGGRTRPCKVSRVDDITYRIILSQGLNRQIRKMSKALGYKVVRLERIRIVNILNDGIDIGTWRNLTKEELDCLKKEVGYNK